MIYCILGTTASGKSSLANKLARNLDLPLIGADAFQIYKELNIGSAKPSKEELNGLTYSLIDDTSVLEEVSVSLYQEKARAILEKCLNEGKDVIVVGGTFLYVKALLFNYIFPKNIQKEDDLETKSKEELLGILEKEDPETFQIIDKNNLRRVIGAIRLAKGGNSRANLISQNQDKPLYPVKFFNIDIDKEANLQNINLRVEEMFKNGLISEVKDLITKFNPSLHAFKAIGYKEVIEGLKENKSEEEIKDDVKLATRQYAKKQRTFLRHQFPNLITLKPEEIEKYITYDVIRRLRNKYSIKPKVLNRIENSSILLVGIGGVGSIIANGLIRLGIKNLTIVDKDIVETSNLNRQIMYDYNDINLAKVDACKNHLLKLDPLANINALKQNFSPELISSNYDFVFDCIDDIKSKADLVLKCLEKNVKFISATGSGLRTQANCFKVGNLNNTGEPLAKKFKLFLKEKGFNNLEKIVVTYSTEVPQKRYTKFVGSNIISPNSQGLCMLSYFLKIFED